MAQTTVARLIINSPFEESALPWKYDRETRLLDLAEGCRPAGYKAVRITVLYLRCLPMILSR